VVYMDGKGFVRPIVPETLDEKDYGTIFPQRKEMTWSRIQSQEDYKVQVHHDSKTLTDKVFIEISGKGRVCWLA